MIVIINPGDSSNVSRPSATAFPRKLEALLHPFSCYIVGLPISPLAKDDIEQWHIHMMLSERAVIGLSQNMSLDIAAYDAGREKIDGAAAATDETMIIDDVFWTLDQERRTGQDQIETFNQSLVLTWHGVALGSPFGKMPPSFLLWN
jgi:hypothetical protein